MYGQHLTPQQGLPVKFKVLWACTPQLFLKESKVTDPLPMVFIYPCLTSSKRTHFFFQNHSFSAETWKSAFAVGLITPVQKWIRLPPLAVLWEYFVGRANVIYQQGCPLIMGKRYEHTCKGEDCKPVWLFHYLTVLPLPHSQGSTKECAGREAPPHHWIPLHPLSSQTVRTKSSCWHFLSFSYSGDKEDRTVKAFQLAKDCRCRSCPRLWLVISFFLITAGFKNETLGREQRDF